MKNDLKQFLKKKLSGTPASIKKQMKKLSRPKFIYLIWPRTKPLSNYYGADRGRPVSRYYEELFIQQNRNFIKGSCLEILDNHYTSAYGTDITHFDILDIDKENGRATITGDLRNLKDIPNNTYDCMILTQVFQYIDDINSAIRACERVLKPGGVMLVSLPSVSRIDCVAGIQGDFWRFTAASAKYLFGRYFNEMEICTWGNVKSSIYYWIGLSEEELSKSDLDHQDDNFPCLVTVKAVKKSSSSHYD